MSRSTSMKHAFLILFVSMALPLIIGHIPETPRSIEHAILTVGISGCGCMIGLLIGLIELFGDKNDDSQV